MNVLSKSYFSFTQHALSFWNQMITKQFITQQFITTISMTFISFQDQQKASLKNFCLVEKVFS